MKKRAFTSGYAEGQKSVREVHLNVVHGRHGTWSKVRQAEEQNALGGIEVQERRGPIFLKERIGAA
jgi:hypothetical protein